MGDEAATQQNAEWFAQQNLQKFKGEWVAVVDQRVVAHGPNLRRVLESAKSQARGRTPYITNVPSGLVTV